MNTKHPHRRRAVSVVNRAYSSDPLERVATIGGINADRTRWQLTQEAAIEAIEAGTDEFFVSSATGIVKLIVHIHGGQKYLRTEREENRHDDLLTLCATVG